METTTKRVWRKDEITTLLNTNDGFLCRAVVKIYERQTLDEQSNDTTSNNNGIGFNGIDAFILSRFAKFFADKKYLSPKQIVVARRKMLKYAKQLTTIANEQSVKPEPAQTKINFSLV